MLQVVIPILKMDPKRLLFIMSLVVFPWFLKHGEYRAMLQSIVTWFHVPHPLD